MLSDRELVLEVKSSNLLRKVWWKGYASKRGYSQVLYYLAGYITTSCNNMYYDNNKNGYCITLLVAVSVGTFEQAR